MSMFDLHVDSVPIQHRISTGSKFRFSLEQIDKVENIINAQNGSRGQCNSRKDVAFRKSQSKLLNKILKGRARAKASIIFRNT